MLLQLKGGAQTTDRRLDRIVHFDERSKAYPIREVVPQKQRSFTWGIDEWLDQGQNGFCVGFSWAHELAAKPKVIPTDYNKAVSIYRAAQLLDEWPGTDYEGTSVLAGAKAVTNMGYMSQYRWAFGVDDLILAIGHAGPAVLGINWYEDMFNPDKKGVVRPTGGVAGGHAILCRGVNITAKQFRLHNSWGKSWGLGGECLVSFDDMATLLANDGEACIPVVRSLGK